MNLYDILTAAIRNVKRRKMRTGLTVLGIVVGIAAIISLISLAQGLQESISSQFGRLGVNNILVTQKGLTGPPIGAKAVTERDIRFLEGFNEFEVVLPLNLESSEIKFNNQEIQTLVSATDAALSEERAVLFNFRFESGKNLDKTSRKEAIIGNSIAYETFSKDIFVGSRIEINEFNFKVIGILEKDGAEQVDNLVSVTREDFKEIFDTKDIVNAINIKVKKGLDVNLLVEKTKRKIEDFRDAEDLDVQTGAQLQEQFRSIIGIVGIIVTGIAAISLLVGGIGIANSMFTSVLERTSEIGVMKAIGARNSDVLKLFLTEAGLIGLGGGIIGVIIGVSLPLAIKFFARLVGIEIETSIKLGIIALALTFSILIGITSGTIPAIQAAKQKPVDALRYE